MFTLNLRKALAIFVDTFLLNGGLKPYDAHCLFMGLSVDGFEYVRLTWVSGPLILFLGCIE